MTDQNLIVHQIFIQDDGSTILPNELLVCTESIRRASSGYNYLLHGGDSLRETIIRNFDQEVLFAYDELVPYSYKADLAKYCLMYLYGGWYFDISVTITSALPSIADNVNGIIFKDYHRPGRPTWDCALGVVYSKKKMPVFETAILNVIANCKNKYYGLNELSPTGPSLFGKAVASSGGEGLVFGSFLPLTPNHELMNFAYILPSGHILAFAKRTTGTKDADGLFAFGANGTNSYNELYYSGKIYKSQA